MEPTPSNPYQTPQSEIAIPSSGGGELASPWIRLGAGIIDGLVLMPINWILQKIFLKMPDPLEMAKSIQSGTYDPEAFMPGKGGLVLVSVLGAAIFIAANFVFLQNGQTIGKKLLKLQIQRRSDGTVLPFKDNILKRLGPVWAVSFLGVLVHPFLNFAIIIDSLCIFRPGRNTLHDDIAGTKVVRLDA